MHTGKRDWFGSTIGLGGRKKFGGALVEGRESLGEKRSPGSRPALTLSRIIFIYEIFQRIVTLEKVHHTE